MKEEETQSITCLKDNKNSIVDINNLSKIHDDGGEESVFLKLEESALNCNYNICSNNVSIINNGPINLNLNAYHDEYS